MTGAPQLVVGPAAPLHRHDDRDRLGGDRRPRRGRGPRPPSKDIPRRGPSLRARDGWWARAGNGHALRGEIGGEPVWPPPDGRPRCAIHTRELERRSRLVFGSCRVGMPEREPYTSLPSQHPDGVGSDALWAYSRRLQAGSTPWPDALLLLGDQVYADDVPPQTAAFIRSRRDPSVPPGEEVADFEEYTRLYRESWSDPDIRWLLSTVPSTMIFDDHDVSDDWNISRSWIEEMRALPWWDERITGAFMSYWLYQHLGNLSPPELAEEEMLRLVQERRGRGAATPRVRQALRPGIGIEPLGLLPRLRPLATARDRLAGGARARRRPARDDRRGRVGMDRRAQPRRLRPPHPRQHAARLHAHGIHHLEALSEAVCDGAWGRRAAASASECAGRVDLEHWPAFQRSFRLLIDLLREIGLGSRRRARRRRSCCSAATSMRPTSRRSTRANPHASHVYQIVCSPFRNPLTSAQRRAIRLGGVPRRPPLRSRASPARAGVTRRCRRAGGSSPGRRSRIRSAASSSTNEPRGSRSAAQAAPRRCTLYRSSLRLLARRAHTNEIPEVAS